MHGFTDARPGTGRSGMPAHAVPSAVAMSGASDAPADPRAQGHSGSERRAVDDAPREVLPQAIAHSWPQTRQRTRIARPVTALASRDADTNASLP